MTRLEERPFAVAALVTIVVTAASHLLPGEAANLAVAGAFLGATWWLVLRRDTEVIRDHGLSLGGLLEPEALDAGRLARAALVALGAALALAALCFPPFVMGYAKLWAPGRSFVSRLPADWLDRVAGQVLVVALPEEAFFRGYLQTALDRRFPPRVRVLGAALGPGCLLSAAIFAVGHLLTIPQPTRLAVFFPALVFAWLRARTGGVGAGVAFHAACNLLSSALALGFGLRAR